MNFNLFDHPRVRQILTLALLSGALLCMFPTRQPTFQWWAEQAFYIATGYLLLGLLFLVMHKPRLMFVCLGCSAAISFFKNEMPLPPAVPASEPGQNEIYRPEKAAARDSLTIDVEKGY